VVVSFNRDSIEDDHETHERREIEKPRISRITRIRKIEQMRGRDATDPVERSGDAVESRETGSR
jgi:hypothetical protein